MTIHPTTALTTNLRRDNTSKIPSSKKDNNIHPIIIELLKSRGYSNEKEIQDFFSWDLKSLPCLTNLHDLTKGASRLIDAVEKGEKIAIYGDYDVDGTSACALLHHFFSMLNTSVELIQPDRFIAGYGLHPESIESAHKKEIDVLVTVDCGITNNEAAERALELGLDLIITDHHQDISQQMPKALAVINPNRRDEKSDSPLRSLAGVGVAFVLCVQMREELLKRGEECPSIYPLLQFVAIGTICDLVKLTPVNLRIVRHGLKQMRSTQYAGINAFLTPEERSRAIPSDKLSFKIGPMINAKGRLEHPQEALNLLIATDPKKAFHSYCLLETCNNERKFIQANIYSQAKEKVLSSLSGDDIPIHIVYQADWHEGVIGIVASKLVENFKVPAIVLTDSTTTPGVLKASARSAGEISLIEHLDNNAELFIKFGGHQKAAGFSLYKENLEKLRENLTQQLAQIPLLLRTNQDHYDLEIEPEDITPKLLRDLEHLEPFGMGNLKPIFKMRNFRLDAYDILKGAHVRWNFSSLQNSKVKLKGISFNYVDKWNATPPEELYTSQTQSRGGDDKLTAYFTLSINHFNGNQYIQLMVEKITLGDF